MNLARAADHGGHWALSTATVAFLLLILLLQCLFWTFLLPQFHHFWIILLL